MRSVSRYLVMIEITILSLVTRVIKSIENVCFCTKMQIKIYKNGGFLRRFTFCCFITLRSKFKHFIIYAEQLYYYGYKYHVGNELNDKIDSRQTDEHILRCVCKT